MFPPAFRPIENYGSPKLLKYMYLGRVKNRSYLCSPASPPRLWSLTLEPAALEDVRFPPVASKASGGCSFNTNHVHNIKKFLKNNNYFIFLQESNSIYKISTGNRTSSDLRLIINTLISKTSKDNNFFFRYFATGKIYNC